MAQPTKQNVDDTMEHVRRIRAVDLKKAGRKPDFDDRQHARTGTPAGFILLFHRDWTPIGPANQFLRATCGNDEGIRTQNAYADDLAQWWNYLARIVAQWNAIDVVDINGYVRFLMESVSHKTGRPLARATIRRRVKTVVAFYDWATGEALTEKPVFHGDARPSRWFALGEDHADWTRTAPGRVKLPKGPRADANVRPFSGIDLHAVLDALGPSPLATEWPKGAPVRDRLIAQVAVLTGMRLMEVCALTTHQISNVTYLARRASGKDLIKIRLETTKNGDPRTVGVPLPVFEAIERYIVEERAAAIAKAVKDAEEAEEAGTTFSDHAVLFVNGIKSNARDRGRPVSTDTVSKAFRRAMLMSGQVDKVKRHGPHANGSDILRARHTFHALRHTFAVNQFKEAVASKQPEPVKTVQVLLGHRHMSTTADIYLAKYDANEAAAADAMAEWLRSPGNGG